MEKQVILWRFAGGEWAWVATYWERRAEEAGPGNVQNVLREANANGLAYGSVKEMTCVCFYLAGDFLDFGSPSGL
jgi:hypothetical protein